MNVRITPAPDPTLTVSIDFHRGAGMQEVLSTAAPTPVPEAYKFGFVASTGLFTEVHLIRNVVVRPVVERPALSLVKRIAEDAQLPDPVPAGTEVPYEYVVTNTGNMSITDLAVFDDVVGFVTCPRTTLDVGDTIVCRGRYTVTPHDALRGTITNVAWATGMADDTEAESPPDEVTIRVTEAEDAPLDLDKIVDDSRPYRPGERVASRYVVTNDSTRTVDGVRVEDSHVANIRCEDTILAPGASTTCTGTFVVPRRGEGRPECDRGGCRFSV
ncbi:MAG: hypothetical protein HOZ81_11850, partial [Streptomyces sp.]|nr:hypothetical protein [Streptomyces sp.]